jgi:hypothetical protein
MSDPNTSSAPGSQPTADAPSGNWRDQRRAERHAWRHDRHEMAGWNGLPIGGLIIVAVGAIFLARNFGLDLPPRWWAIFILLPAAAALVTAARLFRVDGGLSSRAVGSATGGILMLAVALMLYLDLSWAMFWPVMLIIVGIGVLARGWRR